MSFRLAAYAVCIRDGAVMLVRQASNTWSLPGGRVEHGEDPIDTVAREVFEETGHEALIERLLGVDSRVIPAGERTVPGGAEHHNVGIFYQLRVIGGQPRPEPNGETVGSRWFPLGDVVLLSRSSLVDIGIALAKLIPSNGHVPPIAVGGLIQH